MTQKLYDLDSHLQDFTAQVLTCTQAGDTYHITLDQSAFFAGGGGQDGDRGMLAHLPLLGIYEKNGDIVHLLPQPLPVGEQVQGHIDWSFRFRHMQNHSGEHLVSGLIHQKYGYDNVGFHMANGTVTMDYDGVISPEDLRDLEWTANVVLAQNVPVYTGYPSAEDLKTLSYRSKLDLQENVRIVALGDYDICACCAPHVKRTGEIGLIKLLDVVPHRGGARITMRCGLSALEDYQQKQDAVLAVSHLLSAKQDRIAEAVAQVQATLDAEKQKLAQLETQVVAMKLQALVPTEGNLLLFENQLSPLALRDLVNGGMTRCGGLCALFAGQDGDYRYILGSNTADLQSFVKAMNQALQGRGGGRGSMVQGSVCADRASIEAYFSCENYKKS